MAVPTAEGLPAIYDSELAINRPDASPPEGWLDSFSPWLSMLSGADGWMILALSVPSMESLTSYHQRIAEGSRTLAGGPGSLRPETLEARRREARERGVPLDPSSTAALKEWAGRANIPWPGDLGG